MYWNESNKYIKSNVFESYLREGVLLRPRVEVLHGGSGNAQLLCGGCEADGVRAREDGAGFDGVGAGSGGAGAVHADCNTATIGVKRQPRDRTSRR